MGKKKDAEALRAAEEAHAKAVAAAQADPVAVHLSQIAKSFTQLLDIIYVHDKAINRLLDINGFKQADATEEGDTNAGA